MKDDHPPSYWAASAAPADPWPALRYSCPVDVAIVGAGFTGLSTALHLAQRGVACAVVDAFQPGWGASGRNGGQVVPMLKYNPSELAAMLGKDYGERLTQLVAGSADFVYELVERERIDCDVARPGWIQLAHSSAALGTLERRAREWEARGLPIELLDRGQARARIGGGDFFGGWVHPRGGLLHPLKYARGLAAAAARAGAHVFGDSPITRIERAGDKWQLATTAGGTIRAEKVLLATNAYTGSLWPVLDRAVLPTNSLIVATRPLPPAQLASILPRREGVSTTHRLVIYFRLSPDGRLLLGGRGQYRDAIRPDDFSHLVAICQELYGDVGPIEFAWGGRVGITRDFLPRVGELAPGLVASVGYNGRGVALATRMGAELASHFVGQGQGLPFSRFPFRTYPFPQLRKLFLFGGYALFGALDRAAAAWAGMRRP